MASIVDIATIWLEGILGDAFEIKQNETTVEVDKDGKALIVIYLPPYGHAATRWQIYFGGEKFVVDPSDPSGLENVENKLRAHMEKYV